MRPRIALAAWALFAAAACTPTVQVGTSDPIVIKLDIQHEVRIKLDEEVAALMAEESSQAVTTRSGEPTLAARVAELKQSGDVGERADGYLEVTPDGDLAEHGPLVEQVNARRRAAYEAIAAEHATSSRAVEAVAGERRIGAAAPGEPVRGADGTWIVR